MTMALFVPGLLTGAALAIGSVVAGGGAQLLVSGFSLAALA